jgi:cytoskeletal protein CcmA (bactofilin family)
MNTEHVEQEEDMEFSDEMILHGIFEGNVTVKEGGILQLFGRVSKNVIVEPGGTANIHGMVFGDVINKGGALNISGTILGQLVKEAGITKVAQKAEIGTGSNA